MRKLERRYKTTNNAHDRAAWIAALRGMHRNFRIKRSNFWIGRIANQKNNPRKLWSSIDTLLGDFRSTEKMEFCVDDFMCFFDKKVAELRKDTMMHHHHPTHLVDQQQPWTAFNR